MLGSVGQCERKLPRVCVCADRAACPLFPSWSAQKTPVALKLNSFLCPASSHPAENLNLGAAAIKDIAKKNHLPCVCFVNWLVGECKKYVCNLGVG